MRAPIGAELNIQIHIWKTHMSIIIVGWQLKLLPRPTKRSKWILSRISSTHRVYERRSIKTWWNEPCQILTWPSVLIIVIVSAYIFSFRENCVYFYYNNNISFGMLQFTTWLMNLQSVEPENKQSHTSFISILVSDGTEGASRGNCEHSDHSRFSAKCENRKLPLV